MRVILLLFCLACLTAPAAAIVGPSADGDAYVDRVVMALALKGGAKEGVCSGVALSPRVILTAAHCLSRPSDMLVAIRVDGRTQPIRVAAVAAHPGYDPLGPKLRRRSIDLGLIETAAPLPESFHFAELAETAPKVGEPVTAIGFGIRREGGPPSDGHARTAALVASDPVSQTMLWTRDPQHAGLGACHGDSGGPMFDADGRVAAVIAWTNGESGHGCGVITEGPLVAPVRAWIAAKRTEWGQ